MAELPRISDELVQIYRRAADHCAATTHPLGDFSLRLCCQRAGLAAVIEHPSHGCMYQRVYNQASEALDELLGPDEEDGCGQGLVAEIWHLARRCEHFEAEVTDG